VDSALINPSVSKLGRTSSYTILKHIEVDPSSQSHSIGNKDFSTEIKNRSAYQSQYDATIAETVSGKSGSSTMAPEANYSNTGSYVQENLRRNQSHASQIEQAVDKAGQPFKNSDIQHFGNDSRNRSRSSSTSRKYQ
jgi:hypothetical protein